MGKSEHEELVPRIHWDGKTCKATFPMFGGSKLTAEWEPDTTPTIRIREVGTETWSIGFETPVGGGVFHGLKPDTEYEVEYVIRGPLSDGQPVIKRVRTSPAKQAGNVIPFPGK